MKEKSGILNWALEGLDRLLKQGKFSYDKTPEEVKIIMEMSGDPLIQFGAEVLKQSEERISKERMYEIYCFWANKNDKPILSKEQLGRRLNSKVKYLVAKNDTKERFWANVSLKPCWAENLLNNSANKSKDANIDTFDTSKNNIWKGSLLKEDVKNKKKSNIDINNISKPQGGIDMLFSKASKVSKNNEIDFSEMEGFDDK